jgi:3-oxoisoapionate kinase
MSVNKHKLLLAFYGDDFTGSTDALEFLSRAGAKTVLFIEPPTAEQLNRYEGLDAIGVAGMTRSMVPADMEKVLRPAFTSLKELGARHVHYKVCSTFDSSPTIGSIGKAIDVGAEVFQPSFIPLLVAAPKLGRYCAFGNLFARMGIGSKGAIHRLDRHPSMSKHPVTPADESDLRLHLGKQTSKQIGLMDILNVALDYEAAREVLASIAADNSVVLFDAIYQEQMQGIGALIDNYANDKVVFSVGSSGIEMALGAHWESKGVLKERNIWNNAGNAGPILVASGSCSPVTSGQIAWAAAQAFVDVALDTEAIASIGDASSVTEENVVTISKALQDGKNVILHTSKGNDDSRVERTNEIFTSKGWDEALIRTKTAELYGTALGTIVRRVAEQTSLKRIVIAGGDTSSYAARAMGIEAVEMIAPLSPGAPLCKAYAPGSAVDGLEVNFKGGQVGREDYLGMAAEGTSV